MSTAMDVEEMKKSAVLGGHVGQLGDLGGDVGGVPPELLEADILSVQPLGAGSEVGRSCIVVEYKGKKIMLDCGIHPAMQGLDSLPYLDVVELSQIDLLLISHFHIDHCAAVPYLLEKTDFRGRVFMTPPTKAIFHLLLTDYTKVSKIAIDDMLFDEADVMRAIDKIETIDYHMELEHEGIKFWCYNAGHVLGAAMFMIEIAGVRVLYTGDFSRHDDRHLVGAETPHVMPDVLIVESTYGVQVHEPRKQRENRFTGHVHEIVKRGGRCLLPVFALGRAQELLLILDEYWQMHPELHTVPIYYASSLARKCMEIYRTYINMMNDRVRAQFEVSNPFVFKHISNLKSMDHFSDIGASVVMASPGMLQNGLSRELFELWCSDTRNGVVLPGYCVEGTLAKDVMREPASIRTLAGNMVPLRMAVHYISFSAHSDFKQTSEFIDAIKPSNIVLIHGDRNEMGRLKHALDQKFDENKITVHTPKNAEAIRMPFRGDKTTKVMGVLARDKPLAGEERHVSGVLVRQNFKHDLIEVGDLHRYTRLTRTELKQQVSLPYFSTFSVLRHFLEQVFDDMVVDAAAGTVDVYSAVHIVHKADDNMLELEWDATAMADMTADAIMALVMQATSSPASIKVGHDHAHEHGDDEQAAAIRETLKHQYADVDVSPEGVVRAKDADGKEAAVHTRKRARADRHADAVDSDDDDDDIVVLDARLHDAGNSDAVQSDLRRAVDLIQSGKLPLASPANILPERTIAEDEGDGEGEQR